MEPTPGIESRVDLLRSASRRPRPHTYPDRAIPTRKPLGLRKPPALKKGRPRSSKRVLDRRKVTESLRSAINSHNKARR
jgi:hypothetical protein